MKYPWFAPKMQVFESGAVQDMCGEDVSFCLDAIAAGFEIWCDPRIRVGHEKTRVIWHRHSKGKETSPFLMDTILSVHHIDPWNTNTI